MRQVKINDMLQLPAKKAMFVIEYIKDFAPRRAAEAAGYNADYGYRLLDEEEVAISIERILQQRLEHNMIDADALLFEMLDNHMIARQMGNITASNTALNMIAKHKRVDAFAADKIKVSTDADVMEKLVAARKRISQVIEHDDSDDDISFM